MVKQIMVFVDNKPGRLEKITGTLSKETINIRSILISDNGQFGIVKLLVDKPDQANMALSKEGFATAVKDVIAVFVEDSPGKLHDLIKVLSAKNINIADGYGFASNSVFCIETEDDNRQGIEKLIKE
ncbi:MAG TPA: acetolactate synthase, partial [Candidatus Omnitrophota bacterium]|nr:acetolactate synthase [Candidatus Omnitrophota bacterium]